MTHDKDFNPMTKRTHAQVMGSEKSKETKKSHNKEESVTPQQSHDIDSPNGDTLDHSMCKAQIVADAMCSFNEMFKTEENFTNPWQQSMDTNEDKEWEFSEETEALFNNKEHHEQHAQ